MYQDEAVSLSINDPSFAPIEGTGNHNSDSDIPPQTEESSTEPQTEISTESQTDSSPSLQEPNTLFMPEEPDIADDNSQINHPSSSGEQPSMEQDDNLYGTGAGEYHSSDSPNQDTPEENSLEMDDDYHDDPEDESEEDEKPDIITPIVRFIVTISLIILLLFIIFWIIRHFIRKLRKYLSFCDKDRKIAVIRLYSELHQLCGLLFHWSDCVMPSYFTDNLRQGYGDDMVAAYKDVISLCERAAFSDYNIMEEDYQLVYHYVKQIRKLTKKKLTLKEKFTTVVKGKL